MQVKQGEIWYANLNPTQGHEQQGFRPVVVISGNLLNEYTKLVIVCPLTIKLKRYKGNVILQPDTKNNLSKISEVLTFHIRSITHERLTERIGEIKNEELTAIKSCLNDLLKY